MFLISGVDAVVIVVLNQWDCVGVCPQKEQQRKLSVEQAPEIPVMKVDQEKLEVMEEQRRRMSQQMSQRRTSLADVIPDWPTLQKRAKKTEVHSMECSQCLPIANSATHQHFMYNSR